MPIAITLLHYTYVFSQKGAPLDYVRMPRLLGDANYVALANKAPHPNAGKAFIDYFLDDECMNLMAKLGEFVNRKGIASPLEGSIRSSSYRWIGSTQKLMRRKRRNTRSYFCSDRRCCPSHSSKTRQSRIRRQREIAWMAFVSRLHIGGEGGKRITGLAANRAPSSISRAAWRSVGRLRLPLCENLPAYVIRRADRARSYSSRRRPSGFFPFEYCTTRRFLASR